MGRTMPRPADYVLPTRPATEFHWSALSGHMESKPDVIVNSSSSTEPSTELLTSEQSAPKPILTTDNNLNTSTDVGADLSSNSLQAPNAATTSTPNLSSSFPTTTLLTPNNSDRFLQTRRSSADYLRAHSLAHIHDYDHRSHSSLRHSSITEDGKDTLPSRPLRLLDLPPEILLLIYEFALGSYYALEPYRLNAARASGDYATHLYRKLGYIKPEWHIPKDQQDVPSVGYVCKSISEVVLKMVYARARIEICVPDTKSSFFSLRVEEMEKEREEKEGRFVGEGNVLGPSGEGEAKGRTRKIGYAYMQLTQLFSRRNEEMMQLVKRIDLFSCQRNVIDGESYEDTLQFICERFKGVEDVVISERCMVRVREKARFDLRAWQRGFGWPVGLGLVDGSSDGRGKGTLEDVRWSRDTDRLRIVRVWAGIRRTAWEEEKIMKLAADRKPEEGMTLLPELQVYFLAKQFTNGIMLDPRWWVKRSDGEENTKLMREAGVFIDTLVCRLFEGEEREKYLGNEKWRNVEDEERWCYQVVVVQD